MKTLASKSYQKPTNNTWIGEAVHGRLYKQTSELKKDEINMMSKPFLYVKINKI